MFNVPEKRPDAMASISYRDFHEYRDQNQVFSEMAGKCFPRPDVDRRRRTDDCEYRGRDAGIIFRAERRSRLLGRMLLPEDGRQGAAPVAVLSENLWRSRFGANPNLVGRSIALDMRSFTVVGILPDSFRYPDGAPHQDVWISILQDPLFGPLT